MKRVEPQTNLLHWPPGRYVPAANTDLRKRFSEEWARLAAEKGQVRPIKGAKNGQLSRSR